MYIILLLSRSICKNNGKSVGFIEHAKVEDLAIKEAAGFYMMSVDYIECARVKYLESRFLRTILVGFQEDHAHMALLSFES